jgi:hypothetical protein
LVAQKPEEFGRPAEIPGRTALPVAVKGMPQLTVPVWLLVGLLLALGGGLTTLGKGLWSL